MKAKFKGYIEYTYLYLAESVIKHQATILKIFED